MKKTQYLVSAPAFTIAAAGAFFSSSANLPPPYYGVDPDSGVCEQGVLEGTCGFGTTIRCQVHLPLAGVTVDGYDLKAGVICTVPVYRATE
jgi:hypothetical protein